MLQCHGWFMPELRCSLLLERTGPRSDQSDLGSFSVDWFASFLWSCNHWSWFKGSAQGGARPLLWGAVSFELRCWGVSMGSWSSQHWQNTFVIENSQSVLELGLIAVCCRDSAFTDKKFPLKRSSYTWAKPSKAFPRASHQPWSRQGMKEVLFSRLSWSFWHLQNPSYQNSLCVGRDRRLAWVITQGLLPVSFACSYLGVVAMWGK